MKVVPEAKTSLPTVSTSLPSPPSSVSPLPLAVRVSLPARPNSRSAVVYSPVKALAKVFPTTANPAVAAVFVKFVVAAPIQTVRADVNSA